MTFIQVILIAFALFALSRTLVRFHEGKLTRVSFALWALFWLAAAAVVALPRTTEWFAGLLGVGRGVDAVLYLSVALLFYLLFRIFIRLDRMERDITAIIREVGLDRARDRREKR
jgi:hypothetical protein